MLVLVKEEEDQITWRCDWAFQNKTKSGVLATETNTNLITMNRYSGGEGVKQKPIGNLGFSLCNWYRRLGTVRVLRNSFCTLKMCFYQFLNVCDVTLF